MVRAHKPTDCDPNKFKKKSMPETHKQAKETENKKIRFERAVSAIAKNECDEDEKYLTDMRRRSPKASSPIIRSFQFIGLDSHGS